MEEKTNSKTNADEAAPKGKAAAKAEARAKAEAERRKMFTPRRERRAERNGLPPQHVRSELDVARWRAEQDRVEREIDEAYEKHPPGKKLFVQAARDIPSRKRAGLDFPNTSRVEVEIVDASDEEIAKAQVQGQAVVNPMGAKAIWEDSQRANPHGGLVVYEDKAAAPGADATVEAASDEALEAELARRKAARRTSNNPAAPTRLGQGAPENKGDAKGENKG